LIQESPLHLHDSYMGGCHLIVNTTEWEETTKEKCEKRKPKHACTETEKRTYRDTAFLF